MLRGSLETLSLMKHTYSETGGGPNTGYGGGGGEFNAH